MTTKTRKQKDNPFPPARLTATQWDTAEDKSGFGNALIMFIRDNLVTWLHCQDDGMYSPEDLVSANSTNHGKPWKEKRYREKQARGFGEPVIVIRKERTT